VTVSPAEQSSVFALWFDEQYDVFSSFTSGLTQANYDATHYDANAYATGQTSGTYGANLSGGSGYDFLIVVCLPEAGGGGPPPNYLPIASD
jgi:hypothetical protein